MAISIHETQSSITGALSQLPQRQNTGLSSRAEASDKLNGAMAYWDPSKKEEIIKTEAEYNRILQENKFNNLTKAGDLFTFYSNDKKTLMEIKPAEVESEKVFLMAISRITGYQALNKKLDSDQTITKDSYPVYFKKVGENTIQLYVKKIGDRSGEKHSAQTIEKSDSDDLFASARISMINSNTGAMLIDLKDLFVKDFENLSSRKEFAEFKVDRGNSSFEKPRSFSTNFDVQTNVAYTVKDQEGIVNDGAIVSYGINFSEQPKNNNYQPRYGDRRIGHFSTPFNDYTNAVSDDRRKEYIRRWNLQLEPIPNEQGKYKAKKPIVYWITNSVPALYREAIKQGVLQWNYAFENVGIKDAVVVMEEGKDHKGQTEIDPSDVKYNTISWIHSGGGYAIGAHISNPFTGEIYAVDIAIGDYKIDDMRERIKLYDQKLKDIKGEKEREKYIDDQVLEYLTALTIHEVGHTLGLMHNFKASTKQTNGLSASVMDYNAPNFDSKELPNFQTKLGEYDYLAIEYAYKYIDVKSLQEKKEAEIDKDVRTPQEKEKQELDKVVKRMYEAGIPYGTDAYGQNKDWKIDPSCNGDIRDRGNPMEFCKSSVRMGASILNELESELKKPGAKQKDIAKILNAGLTCYLQAMILACKYIGGVYYNRGNVGDLGDKASYQSVPDKEQKEALTFLFEELFSSKAFNFSVRLANELNLDIAQKIKGIHVRAIDDIFSAPKINRIYNNETRYGEKDDPFKLSELFKIINSGIWSELEDKKNISISLFRQNLQETYIKKLVDSLDGKMIYITDDGDKMEVELPGEAVVLAKNSLMEVKNKIGYIFTKQANSEIKIDEETKNFLRRIIDMIKI